MTDPEITFMLNGRATTVRVEADTPLLWVLRDTLGKTGTKYGCGKGLCGSCTVHIDGEPARACLVPMVALAGRRVTTIEAVGSDERHPVTRAWIALDVPQCGYCQPGQIMMAAALLAKRPDPTDDDIDGAMAGILCRCGTYHRIRRAIHLAARYARGENPEV
jgi:aerobic-type carbon monoxide dehydrogenase small subunit (CoxS/CutS family)